MLAASAPRIVSLLRAMFRRGVWQKNAGFYRRKPTTMPTTEYLSAKDWRVRCTEQFRVVVPLLDDEGARQLAENLHAAWPNIEPEHAVAEFMRPVDRRNGPAAR